MSKSNIVFVFIFLCGVIGCRKFVELEKPKNELVRETVFSNDQTAQAAMADLYSFLRTSGFASGGVGSVTFLSGLSSDEYIYFNSSDNDRQAFYDNKILPSNTANETDLWNVPFAAIYQANSILAGLEDADGISLIVRNRLLAEARFIRGFCHFYLATLYGDVPYITSTDYELNLTVERLNVDTVYALIDRDLQYALLNLPDEYLDGVGSPNTERVRVNKYCAHALLARLSLYTENWEAAKVHSTAIIDNTSTFSLGSLSETFKINGMESIWQLSSDFSNTDEAQIFYLSPDIQSPFYISLSNSFDTLFELNDRRRTEWIGEHVTQSNRFLYSTKYRDINYMPPITEYSTVFRLAEQFLIRAESSLALGDLNGTISDINIIRTRAGSSLLSAGELLQSMHDTLEVEKQREFFAEWGHRWFDLKRWPSRNAPSDGSMRRADDVLSSVKAAWTKDMKLYPIPEKQLQNSPGFNNNQNPGYN